MKITPNQDFRHMREPFENGQEIEVPDGLGYYFVMVGWAAADPESVPEDLKRWMPVTASIDAPSQDPGPVDLTVQNITQDSGSSHAEVN